ncbi:GH25 family lysozyme [Lactobacillus crispatus]|jgi:gametolysin|uniref:GH25 family lysozyme n=1 Tax=Lactobacillus crispatus TaxID=47770 RepID=A0ABV2B7M6_9LACO|nr:GH25 family lysozyme [Lactobacillus crispatus]EEX29757.1 glycosyl hydrolase family 25 [Lactobacillus crispatus MV-3A-US]KWU05944.1 glycoside hydrolase family 25 [Lactobacillus crispatus]KXI20556.1 glycosyl hydrolase family 25 [Lactobacillus crispatus]MCT7823496.1 GH25 family lysozyme [Lactobacillus crispatus]MDK7064645.1 GH25 family lysozyme [Lactobacillus crispatus]
MLKMCDVYSDSSRSFATQSGTDITMIKATQGMWYVNPECDVDYQAAKKAGKQLGIYHYCEGGNPEKEAQYFYHNVKGYIGEAVPAVDWESNENRSWGNTTWVKRFVTEFHRLSGVWCLVYVQSSALNQVANCAKTCGLWVACYPSMNWKSWNVPNMNVPTSPWKTYTIWQFTGDNMDRNLVNTTVEGWKKLAKGSKTVAKKKPNWVKKSGEFVLGQALEIHKEPHIDSPAIAKLPKGSVVKYDATLQGPKRLWLRQPRSKGYGYIVGKDKYGKLLGKLK